MVAFVFFSSVFFANNLSGIYFSRVLGIISLCVNIFAVIFVFYASKYLVGGVKKIFSILFIASFVYTFLIGIRVAGLFVGVEELYYCEVVALSFVYILFFISSYYILKVVREYGLVEK